MPIKESAQILILFNMKKKFKTLSIVMVVALVAANVTFVVFDRRNVKSEILLSDVEGLSYNPDWLSDLFSNNDGPEKLDEQDCGSVKMSSLMARVSSDTKNSANASANANYTDHAAVDAGASVGYNGNNKTVGTVEMEMDDTEIPLEKYKYKICLYKNDGHCTPKKISSTCAEQIAKLVEDIINSL